MRPWWIKWAEETVELIEKELDPERKKFLVEEVDLLITRDACQKEITRNQELEIRKIIGLK